MVTEGRKGISRRAVTAAVGGLVAGGSAAAPVSAATGGASVRRGVNIYHMMQSLRLTGPDNDYVWPPYDDAAHAMPEDQVRALAKAGFDFVRLTIAPDIFLRTAGPRNEELYVALRRNIALFNAHGLRVIADLHPGKRVAGFMDTDITGNVQGVFSAYAEVVGKFAAVLASFPQNRVALELLNEPALYGMAGVSRWQAMLEHLHTVARGAAPRLPLILTGAEGGGMKGLLDLDPAPFRNSDVLYSFHYYEPHPFTHQRSSGARKYTSGVSWPPRPGDFESVLARAKAALAADAAISPDDKVRLSIAMETELRTYFQSSAGPQMTVSDFAHVAAWADVHRIPRSRIFLGEFGVSRTIGSVVGASDADTTRWLRTVRSTAERYGFPWALWAYSGPVTMTLANEYPARTFDPGVLNALGLAQVQPNGAASR